MCKQNNNKNSLIWQIKIMHVSVLYLVLVAGGPVKI